MHLAVTFTRHPAFYHAIALQLDYIAIVATPLDAQHLWLLRALAHFIAFKLGEKE